MNRELFVSSTPHETRVGLVEDDQLAEVYLERENEYTLAGSIYKGRVTRVLPGMQSAFVDIGLERDAFLYVSDFLEVGGEEGDEEFGDIPAGRGTVDFTTPQHTAPAAEAHASPSEVEEEDEAEGEVEEFIVAENGNGNSEAEIEAESESSTPTAEGVEAQEGARRWRGRRRRRGGRRGRGDDRWDRPARTDAAPEQHSESASRESERPSFGPPPGYTPIVLPG